jgi:hypothetical protein
MGKESLHDGWQCQLFKDGWEHVFDVNSTEVWGTSNLIGCDVGVDIMNEGNELLGISQPPLEDTRDELTIGPS